jgi:hypothetical protein
MSIWVNFGRCWYILWLFGMLYQEKSGSPGTYAEMIGLLPERFVAGMNAKVSLQVGALSEPSRTKIIR